MNQKTLKTIDEIQVGDKIEIKIPTVCTICIEVKFVNIDKGFVLCDNEEFSIPYYPNDKGFYHIRDN